MITWLSLCPLYITVVIVVYDHRCNGRQDRRAYILWHHHYASKRSNNEGYTRWTLITIYQHYKAAFLTNAWSCHTEVFNFGINHVICQIKLNQRVFLHIENLLMFGVSSRNRQHKPLHYPIVKIMFIFLALSHIAGDTFYLYLFIFQCGVFFMSVIVSARDGFPLHTRHVGTFLVLCLVFSYVTCTHDLWFLRRRDVLHCMWCICCLL